MKFLKGLIIALSLVLAGLCLFFEMKSDSSRFVREEAKKHVFPVVSIEAFDGELNIEEKPEGARIIIADTEGNIILKENCTVEKSGNSSNKYTIKPMKLRFDAKLNIFNEPDSGECAVYKLRNCGTDFEKTMMRNLLTVTIAREAGFTETPKVQPVAVYVDGEFYGLEDLVKDYSGGYIASLYDLQAKGVEILNGGENAWIRKLGYKDEDTLDFNDEATVRNFEENTDVDNLLTYYAFQIIADNCDWPLNNLKAWRYTSGNGRSQYGDGRFRYLLFDLDSCYGGYPERKDCFENLFYARYGKHEEELETSSEWRLMSSMMENKEYRRRFMNILMDLLYYPMNAEHMNAIIDEWVDKYRQEYAFVAANSTHADGVNTALNFETELEKLRAMVNGRREESYGYIYQYFGAESVFTLKLVKPDGGCDIIADNLTTKGILSETGADGERPSVNSIRCCQYETKLEPLLADGTEFKCWRVNGNEYTDEILYIKGTENEILTVELLIK